MKNAELQMFGDKVKHRRLELGLSQEKLATQCGYTDRSSIAKIENGTIDVSRTKIAIIAKALLVSPAYLMGWTDEENTLANIKNISPITTQRIPMLGKIACGKPIYANEDKESYVQAGTNLHADFCLTACGDSMINARIFDGDIVFCRAQEMVENGEIGVVVIGDEATLKRVYYYPEKKKIVLQAENPKYEPLVYINEELDEIHIIGKAVAFQSDVR